MTERHSEPSSPGRRMTTGEFRATPDISQSTAQFQAFAAERGEQTQQWARAMEPAPRSRTRLGVLILAVVVVVAIIAILAVTLG